MTNKLQDKTVHISLRFSIITIFTAIVLSILVNAAIDTSFVQNKVIGIVNSQIKAALPGTKVKFETANVQLFPPILSLYGLTAETKETAKVGSIAQLRVKVSVSSLLFGKPKISSVVITDLQLNLPLNHDAKPSTNTEEPSVINWPPDFDIPIKKVFLRNSKIQWVAPGVDSGKQTFAILEGLNASLINRGWEDMELSVSVDNLNFGLQGDHLVKNASITGTVKTSQPKTFVTQIAIQSKQLNVDGEIQAELEIIDTPIDMKKKKPGEKILKTVMIESDFDVHQADMKILGDYLGADESDGFVDGNVAFQMNLPISGPKEIFWNLNGDARSFHARLSGFKLLESNIEFSVTDHAFIFDHAEIFTDRKAQRPLATGTGTIGFTSAVPIDFTIQPNGISLKTLLSILKVDDFDVIKTDIYSDRLTLKGKGQPFYLGLKGNADFAQMSTTILDKFPEFSERPSCRFGINLGIDSKKVSIDANEGDCYAENRITKESQILLDGDISFSTDTGIKLLVESKDFDANLLEHFTKVKTEGSASFQTEIVGPYDDLKVLNSVRLANFSIGGIKGNKAGVKADFDINQNKLFIPNIDIKTQPTGSITLSKSHLDIKTLTLDGKVTINNLKQDFFSNIFREHMDHNPVSFGISKFEGDIRVPILEPLQLNTRSYLQLNNLTWEETLLVKSLDAEIIADKSNIIVEQIHLASGQHTVKASFQQQRKPIKTQANNWKQLGLNTKDQFTLDVTFHPKQPEGKNQDNQTRSSDDLPIVGDKLKYAKLAFHPEGKLNLEGSYEDFKGSFHVFLKDILFLGSGMDPIDVSGFLENYKLNIPVIRQGGNTLAGRLNLDLSKQNLPFSMAMYLEQYDLRFLLSSFFTNDPRNFAYITAELDLKGDLTDFFNAVGKLTIKNIDSQYIQQSGQQQDKITLRSEKKIVLSLNKDSWEFEDNKSLDLINDNFNLSLALNHNDPPENLNISGEGSLNLSILKDLSPQIETAEGEIIYSFSVTGSISEPKIGLSITDKKLDPFDRRRWKAITIGFIDANPAIKNIEADIVIEDSILTVKKLKGTKGRDGIIDVTGKIEFLSDDPLDSQLNISMNRMELQRLSIPVFKTGSAMVSGDLSIIGRHPPFVIEGNINIDEAASITDFDLRREIVPSIRKSQSAPPAIQRDPLFNIDVSVTSDDNIFIKNKNLDLTLRTDLRIKGNEQEPVVLGQVETVKGTFNYRRKFNIKQSFVSFEEPIYPPDPRLDIIGEADIKTEGINYQVVVLITGRASDPKVSLSIDPPTKPDGTAASKLDVLILLTTGRMQTFETSSGDALQNEAFLLLAGYAEAPLEKIFDLTGQQYIRQIYFDSYLPTSSDEDGAVPLPIARANLPINITDDLNIILQYDRDGNFKGLFQYSLNEKITLSGGIDPRTQETTDEADNNLPADTGLDLKFKFNFE